MQSKLKVTYPQEVFQIPMGTTHNVTIEIENIGEKDLLITEIQHKKYDTSIFSNFPNFNLLKITIKPNEKKSYNFKIGREFYHWTLPYGNDKIYIYSNDPNNIEYKIDLNFKMIEQIPNSGVLKLPGKAITIDNICRETSNENIYLVKKWGFLEGSGSPIIYIEEGGMAESGGRVYLKKWGIIYSANILYYESKEDLQYLKNQPLELHHISNMQFSISILQNPLSIILNWLPYVWLYLISFYNINIFRLFFGDVFGQANKIDLYLFVFRILLGLLTPFLIRFISIYKKRTHSRSRRH